VACPRVYDSWGDTLPLGSVGLPDPLGNKIGDRNGEEICGNNDYGEESCLYWNMSLGRWQHTDPTRLTPERYENAIGNAMPAICGGGAFGYVGYHGETEGKGLEQQAKRR